MSDRIGGDGGNYQNAHGANSPVKKLLGFSGRSGADLDGLEVRELSARNNVHTDCDA